MFSKPNNVCFNRAAQGKLPECNRSNTLTVLRILVKPNECLKGTEPFANSILQKKLKISQNYREKTHDKVAAYKLTKKEFHHGFSHEFLQNFVENLWTAGSGGIAYKTKNECKH